MTRRGDLPPAGRRPRRDSAGDVLRAVLDHGPIARSSVARATRLSAASVSGVVTSLLDRGLVREVPEAAGPPGIGRPHVPLDIEADRVAVIGVHIAVPHTTVALLDLRGQIITQRRDPHAVRDPNNVRDPNSVRDPHGVRDPNNVRDPHGVRDPAAVLAALTERISVLRRTRRRILGLGVATGGWVDTANGTVVDHPLLGWRDVRVGPILAEATGLPTRVDSNSRALLRAEQLFGAAPGRTRESAVHLFVGNVVDVAFAADGVIHHGPRSAAGAVAHLPVEGHREVCACGRTGCLQSAVSERTLVRRALAAGLIDRPELSALIEAAQQGDAEARAMFTERARLVGRAAALLLDLFDPEVLVVSEAGANRLPGCLGALRAEAAAWSSGSADVAATVRASSFGANVLAVAGGAVALDQVFAAPLGRT